MSEVLTIQSQLRSYQVLFRDDYVADLRENLTEHSFVLIDKNVFELYQRELAPILPKARTIVITATEPNKSLEKSLDFVRQLVKLNIRKKSVLVAIGGGIIQDITAFIASILFRGIEWQFYPTTLLAQADSCIGSKNSINLDEYKNLVGTFYPPARIVSSAKFLKSLSVAEIKSGIGEMLHFYFFAGMDDAQALAQAYNDLFMHREKLTPFIAKSLSIKKEIAQIDEFDREIRNLFNYGHTFGHALESISGFTVPHGQAVTLGMDLANFISMRKGLLRQEDYQAMKKILALNKPDFKITAQNINEYMMALSKDKKNTDSQLTCILSRGPGKLEKISIPLDQECRALILDYFVA